MFFFFSSSDYFFVKLSLAGDILVRYYFMNLLSSLFCIVNGE